MKKENLIINISISILVAIGFFFIYKTSADVLNNESKPVASLNYVELHPMIVDSEANSVPFLKNLEMSSSDKDKKVVKNSIELAIGAGSGILESELEESARHGASDGVVIETTLTTITNITEHFIDDGVSNLQRAENYKKQIATTVRGGVPSPIIAASSGSSDENTEIELEKQDLFEEKDPVYIAQVDSSIAKESLPTQIDDTLSGSEELQRYYLYGKAIDGYLKNAIVCLDLNGDGYCQISQEPTTHTDENGAYKLVVTKSHRSHIDFDKAMVIVFDGIDIDTGKRFEGKLVSVNSGNGNINLSPITTLVAQKVKIAINKNENISSDQIQDEILDAQKKVARVLDIDEKDIGEDPVQLHQEGNADLLQKSLQLQKSIETLVITARKNSSLDSATITENIYIALARGLDNVDELGLNSDKEEVFQSPKSKNGVSKKPVIIVENFPDLDDGVSRLLEKAQDSASRNEEVRDLLGGEESIEMVSVAQQISANIRTAFEEIESAPEEERHIVALSIRQDLQEVEKSLTKVVDIDQISEKIVITPNDNRFEDKDWEKKYIEDDLLALGIPCLNCSFGLVLKLKELLLSENESIKPGMLLEGSDELLLSSEDRDIQNIYQLVLKERSANLVAKNILLDASQQVAVNIIEKEDEEDRNSELSTLSKLLFNGLYYAVQENSKNLLEVSFDLPSQGEVSVQELSGEQRAVISQYSIDENHLRVPINNYDFIFVSQEEDYLLFENGRRMYSSFEKAKEFIDSFLSDEEQISVELSGVLKNGLYYAVEDGKTDLLEVSFDDPDEGLITIQELSGDHRLVTIPYTIENNQLTTPINEYLFTFIKHKGSYLLFEDNRRMYYSEEEARIFIEESLNPPF